MNRVFTIASGEKNRKLVVTLVRPKPPEPPQTESTGRGVIHPGAWALSTVALAGFGVFIGFGIQSITLEECQPICSDDQVDEIKTHRVVADVGLAFGATALAAAVVVAIVLWDSNAEDVASLELRFDGTRARLRGEW